MKYFTLSVFCLLALPTIMMAQFDGGIGRGDITAPVSDAPADLNVILVAGSTGADGYYPSLTNAVAAFAAINAEDQAGRIIVVTIMGNSTSETGTNTLNAGNWISLTIYPKNPGLSIGGDVALPNAIALNGADHVTIDGRLNASRSVKDLTISKIKFINAAENNNIKYCTITGDFSMSGTSTATMDGEMTVGGNVVIENGSILSTSPESNLSVSGNLNIQP